MMKRIRFCFVMSALILAGCEAGPDYQAPKITVAPSFGEAATTQPDHSVNGNHVDAVRWWRGFNDPELNSLIDRATVNNLDLRLAESRLRQARAQRGVVGSALWPEINSDGGYQHARGSKNVVIPVSAFTGGSGGATPAISPAISAANPTATPALVTSGGGTSGGTVAAGSAAPPGGPQSPLGNGGFPGVTTDLYQAGFDASWEVDVFGGQRRADEAADADTAVAALEDRRDVRVSLLAEVARRLHPASGGAI